MTGKIEKIKKHFSDNKKAYIVGGSCLAVGAVTTYLVMKNVDPTSVDSVDVVTKTSGIYYKSPVTNNITTILERRGHPGNIIKCNETGEIFASVSRAAELLDIPRSSLRNHLNGLTEAVKGMTFENLGEAQ